MKKVTYKLISENVKYPHIMFVPSHIGRIFDNTIHVEISGSRAIVDIKNKKEFTKVLRALNKDTSFGKIILENLKEKCRLLSN